MGGCCCCLSKDTEPLLVSEEAVPLSSQNGSAPAISSGLLVNTNLEINAANAYMPLPAPVLDNVIIGHSQTADGASESETDKDSKLSECKDPTSIVSEKENESDIELSKNVDPDFASFEECPTCLEEYDEDNPKVITKCSHDFHLACILEWMERSNTCPVCGKEMVFSTPVD